MPPRATFDFDEKKRDELNKYYGLSRFKMPLTTTPNNFDIRWLMGFASPVFGGNVDPYYSEAQEGYNIANVMAHLTAGMTHADMLTGLNATVVLTNIKNRVAVCNVLDENGLKLVADRNKPKIQRKIDELIANVGNIGATTKFASFFGNKTSTVIEKIVVPGLAVRHYAPSICIPFIREFIDGGPPATVGEFTHVANETMFSMYFLEQAKRKVKKGTKVLPVPNYRIMNDGPRNRSQCQNNICVFTDNPNHHCVPNGSGTCT